MAKTNAEIQAASDARKRARGWVQKKYWCTREEHKFLGEQLTKYRKREERKAKRREKDET